MDTEWALDKLEKYVDLCERYDAAYRRALSDGSTAYKAFGAESNTAEPTVLKILALLDPGLVQNFYGPTYSTSANGEVRARMGIGILRDQAEWAIRLVPTAPSLSADELHPVIWESARSVWAMEQYKIACQQACTALSAWIKSRAGSHLNERELVAYVFSTDLPKKDGDRPRLHLPGDREDDDWKSRQQGLHLVSQGAFAGIRNIAVHDEVPWTDHQALEHLAVLSVVARWAEQTELRQWEAQS